MPTKGKYPLGHIYMSVTFGTPENYKTEFLRFEVARLDCGYNAIIGRPGLAKFMAIPHYPYMILKMSGPQGIITVHAAFQGAAECFRGAIQTALTCSSAVRSPALVRVWATGASRSPELGRTGEKDPVNSLVGFWPGDCD
jgi:hypothetical protein